MGNQSTLRVFGALLVLIVAIISAGIIAMTFIWTDQMVEGESIYVFFIAGVLMVVCAVIANLYDLRGILSDGFG